MIHTYSISGMTCGSCQDKVQKLLTAVPGVFNVTVDLEKGRADVAMREHVPTEALQKALAGTQYKLAEEGQAMPSAAMESAEEKITLKTYLPIFLIFGYITGITLLVQFVKGGFDMEEWMRHFMAGFFLTFSFFKLLDVPAFAMSYRSYDIVAKIAPGYGYIYPFIELALGVIFLIPSLALFGYWAAFIVMAVSIIGVIQSMVRKSKFQCACLGAVFKLPLSKVTLFEDALMIVMSGMSLLMVYA
jgi:copper chaperone CopZ